MVLTVQVAKLRYKFVHDCFRFHCYNTVRVLPYRTVVLVRVLTPRVPPPPPLRIIVQYLLRSPLLYCTRTSTFYLLQYCTVPYLVATYEYYCTGTGTYYLQYYLQYNLQPTTYNLLRVPTICYLLPTTYYLLPTSTCTSINAAPPPPPPPPYYRTYCGPHYCTSTFYLLPYLP